MTYFSGEAAIEPRIEDLFAMLTYCRPAHSKSERKFIKRFIAPHGMETDRAGNLFKRIGTAPILWSAHTDTVHKNGGHQTIATDGDEIALTNDTKSNCLGADNAAGVWMLLELMKAGKEGLYVFHRGEEVGGKGSGFLVKNSPKLVEGIKAAIAFDRRGTTSIITHQRGGRRCSDAFVDSLSTGLAMGHKGDSTGTFTDTANYSDLIGECTNISVGFSHEHTEYERVDVAYLETLRDSLLNLDLAKLEFSRKPGETEPRTYYSYGSYCEWDYPDYYRKNSSINRQKEFDLRGHSDFGEMVEEIESKNDLRDLQTICERYPAHVADFLEWYGHDVDELLDHIARIETGRVS